MVATLRIDGAHASMGELGCDAERGARGHSEVHAISMPRCASAVGRPAAGGIAASAPAARRVAAWTLAAARGAAARAAALALRSLIVALALMAPVLLSASGASAAAARVAGEAETEIEEGERLPAGEEIGAGRFGREVALSADGETALVSGTYDDDSAGAAWVFRRSGSGWVQQARLTAEGQVGSGEVGPGHFGRALALSADGDTALVSAPMNRSGRGAVWVFTRSGSNWSQQAVLTGEEALGGARFGRSLAISADGNTAIIGAPLANENAGAAWVFVRSGSDWTQEGSKLTGAEEAGEGQFGGAVALSGDGETALVGGLTDNDKTGAAWVFARSGSDWTQEGSKLTGAEEAGEGQFGGAVALSQDGGTALIGGPTDSEGLGAAWVFARSGARFEQQGAKLPGESIERHFGSSVALSSNGDTGLIGDASASRRWGGAWLVTLAGSEWSRVGVYLTQEAESEDVAESQFGRGVALSGDGQTALVGGPGADERLGAAWVFEGRPVFSKPPPEEGAEEESGTGTGTGRKSKTKTENNSPGPEQTPQTGTSQTAKVEIQPYKAQKPATPATASCRLVGSVIEVSRKDRASARLVCTGNHNASGKLTLTVTKRVKQKVAGKGAAAKTRTITKAVTIAAVTFTTAPNKTVVATLSLNKTGRSLLRARHGRLTAAARLAKLAPAPAQTRTATVQLLLQKPASKKAPKK